MEDKYKFFRQVSPFLPLFFLCTDNVISLLRPSATAAFCLCMLIDLTFSGFPSGVLSAMSAMVNLEIPWINIMSKMDLVTSSENDAASGRNGIRARKDIAR